MANPIVDPAKPANPLPNAPLVMVVLLLVDSLHFVFARLLLPYLPPTTSSMYYMAVATVQIAVFAALFGKIDWRIFRKHAGFFLFIGFLVASATAMSFSAVAYIDPGTASLIARMNTIFALGLSIFWLKERLQRGEKIGAVIAIIGVFVISFQPGKTSGLLQIGTLLVLSANLAYALHAATVKRYGEKMDFANFFLFRMVSTTLFLIIFAVWRGEAVWPSGPVWWILLLTATVNVTISRTLYYLVLRRLKLSLHTILLTLSPVVTILWSLALFGERPSLQGLLGGTAVILGGIIVTKGKRNGPAYQQVE